MSSPLTYSPPQLTTRSGLQVHPVGIGTWNIGGTIRPEQPGDRYRGVIPAPGEETAAIAGLRFSLDQGQNHVDCAELYGGFYTDEVVGRALAGYPRQELFIADKLWKCSVGQGKVRPTVEAMLAKLGTDYLDLLYIHAPFDDAPWHEAIPQIDDLIDQGIVHGLGVSNFSQQQLADTLPVAVHGITAAQQHFSVVDQTEADESYRQFCHNHGIAIVAYSPLERGQVETDSVVQQLATKHRTSTNAVALAWAIQLGTYPIPKSTDPAHIAVNLQCLDLRLSNEDMQQLTHKD